MTLLQFSRTLISITRRSELYSTLCNFIDLQPINKSKKSDIKEFINSIASSEFTQFALNIGRCQTYCIDELNKDDSKSDVEYNTKLQSAKDEIDFLSLIYQEIVDDRKAVQAQSEQQYTVEQQKNVLEDLVQRTNDLKNDWSVTKVEIEKTQSSIKEAQNSIDRAQSSIEKTQSSIDEKMFTMLINTVAILGIFVAIAFTGFGISKIFPTIDFTTSLTSPSLFSKNLFLLLLVCLVSYNLLLLLVYMIFKLSRPLFLSIKRDDKNVDNAEIKTPDESRFIKLINFTPFIWIDIILLAITCIAFGFAVAIW